MPEPQSAVGRNPTALFHLYARIVIRRAANAIDRFGVRVFLGALHRLSWSSPFLSLLRKPFAAVASRRACGSGLPGWRAKKASVTLAFHRPCGRENGRQFSYKHNAEDGVRLDEKRGTMDRGSSGGTCRRFVVRRAPCRLLHIAAHARPRRSGPRRRNWLRSQPSSDIAFLFRILHADDIAGAHRDIERLYRSACRHSFERIQRRAARENQCRHRNAR